MDENQPKPADNDSSPLHLTHILLHSTPTLICHILQQLGGRGDGVGGWGVVDRIGGETGWGARVG